MDPETVRSMLEDFIREKKTSETFFMILHIGARLTPNANSSNYNETGYDYVLSCMTVDEDVLVGQNLAANYCCDLQRIYSVICDFKIPISSLISLKPIQLIITTHPLWSQ